MRPLAVTLQTMFGGEMAPHKTTPAGKFGGGNITVWGCFSSHGKGRLNKLKEHEWTYIPQYSLNESVAIHQDDEDGMWVDHPAGQ